jgi:thiamine biosynthesis protein ThiS
MGMINVNDKPYDWSKDMNIYRLLRIMGYKLQKPAVLITVNNSVIRRDAWDDFYIPDTAEISVINLLRGG